MTCLGCVIAVFMMRRVGGELHGKIKWRGENSNGILENITILLRHLIFTNTQKDCNMLGVTLQRKKINSSRNNS